MHHRTFSITVQVSKITKRKEAHAFVREIRKVLQKEEGGSVFASFEKGILRVDFIPLHDLSFVQGVMLGIAAGLGVHFIDGFEITAD